MPQPPHMPAIGILESPAGPARITGVDTSLAAFVGFLGTGPLAAPVLVTSWQEFERHFGSLDPDFPMSWGAYCFFLNGGRRARIVRLERGSAPAQALVDGLAALHADEDFNLLCLPDTFDLADVDAATVANAAIALCESRRAFYLLDAPRSRQLGDIADWVDGLPASRNAAVYFPALALVDPLDSAQTRVVAPSGAVAGVYVRTDSNRGVWKSPAGAEASLNGLRGLATAIGDAESDLLNPRRVNALRRMPNRFVVWGARTLAGADTMADDYKYIPVRRLGLYIEQSLARATQWAVFEPNDEPLWARLRLQVGEFMQGLFRSGAFQGRMPKEAWFVECDASTTTMADINAGVVNIVVGFAPLKPAEFLILNLRQRVAAGD